MVAAVLIGLAAIVGLLVLWLTRPRQPYIDPMAQAVEDARHQADALFEFTAEYMEQAASRPTNIDILMRVDSSGEFRRVA